MEKLVEVRLKAVEALAMEYVLFLGNEDKTFAIFIGADVGASIVMYKQGMNKPRPLTHDLVNSIFLGLGVTVEKVTINDLKNNTYFARLFLEEKNEIGRKIIEVDARPSDSIALALRYNAPIYVAENVFSQVEDVTRFLKEKQEKNRKSKEDEL